MLSRRQLLALTAQAATTLALPGCASSPPLRNDNFVDLGDATRPYLGLATSLHKEYDYPAKVEGTLPPQIRGTLYRNGPGLFDRGGQRKRNLLDGDGMVQAFTFTDAGVRYRNRFVRTKKYLDEQAAGQYIYPSWSTQAPGGFLANFLGTGLLNGQAGITVYPWRGKLYVFDECSLPYELDPVSLHTSGIARFGLPDGFTIYAAHAKFDPVTGEWVHFGVLYGPKPKLHITIFGPDGSLRFHRMMPMPRNVYLHDWFVSQHHVVLSLHPMEISFWSVFLGRASLLDSLSWRPERGNLVIVLERRGAAAPLLLETEARFMWHSLNAFNDGEYIVADFVGYQNPDHFVGPDPVSSAVMQGRRGKNKYPGELRRYRIHMGSRKIREELLSVGGYEWPRVNELHRCYDYRFGYLTKARPGDFFWTMVCRIDLRTGRTETYDFGTGCYIMEPVFVPLPGRNYQPQGEEPGFLLAEGYDGETKRGFLAILRAENVGAGPIAIVHLEHHVPFSYHGWWNAAT